MNQAAGERQPGESKKPCEQQEQHEQDAQLAVEPAGP
jgi:hypothetical protein